MSRTAHAAPSLVHATSHPAVHPDSPPAEHAYRSTLAEEVFYPDHPNPRTAGSATFRRTRHEGKLDATPCCISGQTADVEYHHVFCEWAWADAVDWHQVQGVALGTITQLPVLDLDTDQPGSAHYPAEQSLLWMMIQITKARGFDWRAFDPDVPETFVDSPQNMLPLHKKFHRGPRHGAHAESAPIWGFQLFPRKHGFVYSPDELKAVHGAVHTSVHRPTHPAMHPATHPAGA